MGRKRWYSGRFWELQSEVHPFFIIYGVLSINVTPRAVLGLEKELILRMPSLRGECNSHPNSNNADLWLS